ncbi:MAG: flagellar hook capping FlgD N-terminal domain-containing protein [Acidimicrobiales bacterium]
MSITPIGGLTTPYVSSTSLPAAGTGTANGSAATSGAGSTNGSSNAGSTSNSTSSLTNPQMFLQLLIAELQNQDPTNPTSPSTILAQTSQLAQMESVTTQTTAITSEQTAIQDGEATGLVGRTVTATVPGSSIAGSSGAAKTVTGVVSDAQLTSNGVPTLTIAGTTVPLADVTQVSNTTAATTSAATTSAATAAAAGTASAATSGSGGTSTGTSTGTAGASTTG